MPKQYSALDLQRAVSAVRDGGMSIRCAQREYAVPFNTLRRRVQGLVDENCVRPGPQPALGIELELELKDVILEMAKMGHGVSRKEVMELAGKVDSKNATKVFKNALPSKVWYKAFMKRHELTLRKPEHLSIGRINMSTITVKNEFFDTYEKLVNDLGVSGNEIYNVDESGLTIVNKGARVITEKGAKTVVSRKSGERSENITVMGACNATGMVLVPPMVIFKGARLNEDVMMGAPEGTFFATSPKGYIDSELFFKWFVRFIHCIPPKRPVLLLLDGHSSHMSRELIVLARSNDVHFLCFPPHTTHLYQALDVGVFGPLKKAFSDECRKLIRKNKRKSLNRYDFCKMLKPSWLKAFTPENVVGGFAGSGTWPIDRNVIRDETLFDDSENLEPRPTGGKGHINQQSQNDGASTSRSPVAEVVRELLTPEAPINDGRRSRRITKTRVLTSDEFFEEMDVKNAAKNNKKKTKSNKIITKRKRKTGSEEAEEVDVIQKPAKKKSKKKNRRNECSSDEESEEPIDEEHELSEDDINEEECSDSDDHTSASASSTLLGDHVIVIYEEEFFPGTIIEKKRGHVRVTVMVMSGPKGWRWPDEPDIHWYPDVDVIKKIKPPKLINARGVCEIPEIAQYRR